jgi:hypothetical protein
LNPSVLRVSSHQKNTAAARAMNRPTFTRRLEPNRCGSRAFGSMLFEIAWPYGGAWKPFTDSRKASR